MAEEKKTVKLPHSVILENRKSLTATGVSNVDSFDEQAIVAYTDLGELTIKGKGLNISRLNIETGELNVTGDIQLPELCRKPGLRGNIQPAVPLRGGRRWIFRFRSIFGGFCWRWGPGCCSAPSMM